MPVLLLGATGNIGSRLLPALLAHKQSVIVYVRNEQRLRELIPATILSHVVVVNGDATDSDGIRNALVQHKCDKLINTAGLGSVLPWTEPQMQDIINAVATGAVNASKELNHPIRAWFMGGMSVLDIPGMEGTQLMQYFPLFTEHNLTYIYLSKLPQENIQWSMFCPSQMSPSSKTITLLDVPRGNSLDASADVPPGFQNSFLHQIPYLGPFISVISNAFRYGTILEDCADFIAADLEREDTKFVGHRVGVITDTKGAGWQEYTTGCNCDGIIHPHYPTLPSYNVEFYSLSSLVTSYTQSDINAAASQALSLASNGQTLGRDKYPHAYNDYEHFSFSHASKPYLEFPIMAGSVYDGSSPGADRVVIGSIASDYSSAVYCAVITHDGQRKNGFAECSDDTMNSRGKGNYEAREQKGHHHRKLLDKIEL